MALRTWNTRHPSLLAPRHASYDASCPQIPQINFSSIPVSGDVGGLLCTVGTVVIVIIGLPQLLWYFVAALTCGPIAAMVLFRWRRAHPLSTVSARMLVAR